MPEFLGQIKMLKYGKIFFLNEKIENEKNHFEQTNASESFWHSSYLCEKMIMIEINFEIHKIIPEQR